MATPNDALETVKDSMAQTEEVETQVQTVPAEPRLFGRYRPIRELGRGGGGIVWLARDEVLGIPVALKLVPDLVVHDTEGIIDLKKEVLRGMALTHPGIVRVFSFEQDSSSAAIVMEYVEGESLTEYKARQEGRCFDCEQVRHWIEQLCAALEYAHKEACIAHRDLKPRNIMVAPNGRVKIADFGIASSLTDSLSRVSVRADTSGTPPYMSPQQAMGERPSHLDDIYSLGATIYELLTSKPPFFRGDILAQVLHEDPPPMAQRRIDLGISGREPIPETWERLVAACLAKNPSDRPTSATTVLELLNPKAIIQAPVLSLVQSQPQLEPALVIPQKVAPARPTITAKWVSETRPRRGSEPWQWPRTLINIVIAAALTAGVLHGLRIWMAHKSTAASTERAGTPTPQTNAASIPAPVAGPYPAPAGWLGAPPPPPGRLSTGNLEVPPEHPPRRGPHGGPPPHPPGRP